MGAYRKGTPFLAVRRRPNFYYAVRQRRVNGAFETIESVLVCAVLQNRLDPAFELTQQQLLLLGAQSTGLRQNTLLHRRLRFRRAFARLISHDGIAQEVWRALG